MTKLIIGVLLCVGGAALSLYVGMWVCFVGGIVDIIQEIRADNLVALNIAIGVAKVLSSGFFGVAVSIGVYCPWRGIYQSRITSQINRTTFNIN